MASGSRSACVWLCDRTRPAPGGTGGTHHDASGDASTTAPAHASARNDFRRRAWASDPWTNRWIARNGKRLGQCVRRGPSSARTNFIAFGSARRRARYRSDARRVGCCGLFRVRTKGYAQDEFVGDCRTKLACDKLVRTCRVRIRRSADRRCIRTGSSFGRTSYRCERRRCSNAHRKLSRCRRFDETMGTEDGQQRYEQDKEAWARGLGLLKPRLALCARIARMEHSLATSQFTLEDSQAARLRTARRCRRRLA